MTAEEEQRIRDEERVRIETRRKNRRPYLWSWALGLGMIAYAIWKVTRPL